MSIVRFALKYPYTFYVLAAFILFVGVSAIVVMPEDIFPEIKIPVVSVIWHYTGLSVPEMEQRITTYSEFSISTTVTGIKDMEAQALNGISVLKIYFQTDVNLDQRHLADRRDDECGPFRHAGRHPAPTLDRRD
jgi:multidrug efflux pump subunit AcrB